MRVVGARDTVAAPAVRVVLHRVGRATQGPIDSMTTDAAGAFRFPFRRDTTANYLVSARFAGIEYFSAPLRSGQSATDERLDLLVFDTSSAAPARARSRTLVVSAPDAAGPRTVVDWFTIVNEGVRTRVGVDSTAPTWSAALPDVAQGAAVGDARFSQFSPDAVVFQSDSVFVTAPLSPGAKSLLLEYELPAGARGFTLGVAGIDSLDVFVEESGARIATPGWAPADTQLFQGRTFYRHRRLDRSAERLDLRFPGVGLAPGPVLVALVSLLAVALLGATAWRWRRRPAAAPSPSAPPPPVALADRIARLDAEHRAAPGDEAARAAYREERARLMAELRDALAGSRRRS